MRKPLSVVIVLCLLVGVIILPASASGARVVFSATAPDADGLFTVNVTAYDVTFEGIQFTIAYNADAVAPASWATGEITESVQESINKTAAVEGMSIFSNISGENELIMLGYSEDDPDFSITAGPNGVKLLSIRFMVIGQELSDFCVKNEAGESCLSYQYSSLPVTYLFEIPQELNGGTAVSETTETAMTKAERAENTVILQIGNYAAAKDGALCRIYPGEKKITPYIKVDENGDGHTMVPVRFVAEALGAEVGWDGATNMVTVTLGGSVVKMTIGSRRYTVDGAKKTMDVAPEIRDNGDGSGRTMVPLRLVAEALGKSVYWDESNSLIVITEPDAPWQADRAAEQALTQDVLLIISPLVRDTIQ